VHAVIHSPQQAFSQQSSGAAASRSHSHSSATNMPRNIHPGRTPTCLRQHIHDGRGHQTYYPDPDEVAAARAAACPTVCVPTP